MLSRLFVMLVVPVLICPPQARAQARGTVVDSEGKPLSAVAVELWSQTRRVAAAVTDAHGVFSFPAGQVSTAVTISFTRIGLKAKVVGFAENELLTIRMELEPTPLAPVTAIAARSGPCQMQHHGDGEPLWRLARLRYSMLLGESAVTIRMYTAPEQLVDVGRLGVIDDSRLTASEEAYTGTAIQPTFGMHTNVNTQITERGYAVATGLEYPAWRFPDLGGRHAYHFTSDEFIELNALRVLSSDNQEVTLAVCSRERRLPSLEGVIVLGADTSFVSASWRFITIGHDEPAGGEVLFFPPKVSSQSTLPLLPARSFFWHRHHKWKTYFYQTSRIYVEWIFAPEKAGPVSR